MTNKNNTSKLAVKRHVARPHWMMEGDVQRLLSVLQGDVPGDEPQALFVGGCVRNTMLDKEVDDIDLATVLPPDAVTQILEKSNVRVVPTGIDHGTVTAVMGDQSFEITTLRHDTETDGRHAVVDFTESWIEDAKRRDFTINTLLMDIKGNIYDPLEQGLKDLDQKQVRFVGEAEKRIEEDYLRILRFFRFSALYGDGFDEEGLKACQKHAHKIETLSRERITQEVFKIIASDDPTHVFDVMFKHEIMTDLKPNNYDREFFEAFCRFQAQYRLQALSSRLFVFAMLDINHIQNMEKYILFPKVFLKDMRFIEGSLTLSDLSNENVVKESLYRFGRAITAQSLMVELVQDRVMNRYAPEALDIIQNWDIPDFPISGEDLIKEGFKPGPELGEELARREQVWIEGGFKN